jgi:paraquat-inducible protein A
MYPIAALVFTASIMVPVLKILALGWLIFARNRSIAVAQEKTRVYRIVELVGRWSMVDIFMIGILTALVQLGNLATIVPGAGALAFASVVVLTMLASSTFDPRSVWRTV